MQGRRKERDQEGLWIGFRGRGMVGDVQFAVVVALT